MQAKKFDIKAIENLINNRKAEQTVKQKALGESIGVTTAVDNELNELVVALHTGNQNSRVVNKMKVVEHRANNIDPKTGRNNNSPLDENTIKHITTQTPKTPNKIPMHESLGGAGAMKNDLASKERDDLMFNNFNGKMTHTPMHDIQKLYNQSNIINEYNGGMNSYQDPKPMQGINPQIIQEQIGQQTQAFINEHFVNLADKALKNHIVETYAIDRVKKVLIEQMQPVIKEMVLEIIREIQNKNKKKSTN